MSCTKTILVIEDETSFRRSITAFLEDSGFQVLEAANGQDALGVLDREQPELILTDLRMPIMDGIDLIKHLKSSHPAIPIITITGTSDDRLLNEALQLGAVHYFNKPIKDMNQLVEAIERATTRN